MPKKLFFKLTPEKQQRILDAATEEFIAYKDNYKKSSVNRIAENAGIAVGSIYKYFYDKNDLFLYVYNRQRTEPDVRPGTDTFYNYYEKKMGAIESLTPTGKAFLEIIGNTSSLFHDIVFDNADDHTYMQQLYTYLQNDQEKGYLREDVDTEIAAYMYLAIDYIVHQYRLSKGLGDDAEEEISRRMTELFFFGLYKDGIEKDIR